MFSDEEEEEQEKEEEEEEDMYFHGECMEKDDHLVADIVHGGESLLFLSVDGRRRRPVKDHVHGDDYNYYFPQKDLVQKSQLHDCDKEEEEIHMSDTDTDTDTDAVHNFGPIETDPTSPITINLTESGLVADDETYDGT